MKTVVYQSFHTTDMPSWMRRCTESVKTWASMNGYDYEFIDGRMFELLPPWFRNKAEHLCTQADLGRLLLAREFLSQGYERTLWADTDILVFAPKHLNIAIEQDFAFCREIWFYRNAAGVPATDMRITNSITAFAKKNMHLEFFIDAAMRIAWHREKVGKLDLGTAFLSHLGMALPLPLINNMGMFSPLIMHAIAQHERNLISGYARHLPAPLACANLCGSLLGQTLDGITVDQRLLDTVIDNCLDSHGEIINQAMQLA